MSGDLKFFIEMALKNTEELSEKFSVEDDFMVKMCVDFTHKYILELAKQFGYEVPHGE